jgi:hypothetical protein
MLTEDTIDAYSFPVPIARIHLQRQITRVTLDLPLESVEQLNEITATSGKTREAVVITGLRAFHRALFGY